ncbi:hypothetical protein Pelo_18756 [Pelomyxa schiedti]|nr:hypothetical protein Pelo_18756 [Pelomyxa schiedti]
MMGGCDSYEGVFPGNKLDHKGAEVLGVKRFTDPTAAVQGQAPLCTDELTLVTTLNDFSWSLKSGVRAWLASAGNDRFSAENIRFCPG